MDYINKVPSLEEMSSSQLAISLCQQDSFKEIALHLEKPTYGIFIRYNQFLSDPEKLSMWASIDKRNDHSSRLKFERSCLNDKEKVRLWEAAIEEQCQILLKGIPAPLKKGMHIWIIRIALEYMSYSRRQEALFGVTRYLLMNVLTCEDWTKAGRLDEKKLALRFLEDGRLTGFHKYRIACAYCLHTHIPQLRARLTREEKKLTTGEIKSSFSDGARDMVLLWSHFMDRREEEKTKSLTKQLWTIAMRKATLYGNRTAVMLCWERLDERTQQKIVFDMALLSLQSVRKLHAYGSDNKFRLVSNRVHTDLRDIKVVEHFNLPSYHSELMCFFLSQMDEERQLTFFKKAFQSGFTDRIVECFLDWPHQDYFLPTINRLWGVIPKDKYGQCLLTLANKYSTKDKEGNGFYDYRSLLGALWEETPKEYKQYVLSGNGSDNARYVGYALLCRLLDRSCFQKKDETLFKLVFRDLSENERRCLIDAHSGIGENICALLMHKENWSFVDWLLEACLPNEEIPNFKKELIQSDVSLRLCVDELNQNRESLVKDLINWGFVSNKDKKEFKCALRKLRSEAPSPQLCEGECDKKECICKLWYRMKKRFLSASERGVPTKPKSL